MSTLRAPGRWRALRLRRAPVGPRGLAVALVLLAVLAGAFLWFRQSSFVTVRVVTITGVSGPHAAEIRDDLQAAARSMTTLDVRHGRLHAAVAPYPVVHALRVSTDFPHGMRITVHERIPVAIVVARGRRTAVTADGTLLPRLPGDGPLPTIAQSVSPGGTRLTGAGRQAAGLLGAAPYALLAKVASAERSAGRGLVATLRDGPTIYFGAADALVRKWSAVVAVLGAPTSAGASYIDVTDPARPAAGTGGDGGSVTPGSTPASPPSPTTTGTSSASSP